MHVHRSLGYCGCSSSLVIGLLLVAGCGAPPAAAPTAYTAYNSKGGTFACEYPEGWQADGGGGRGPEWAKFQSGDALIHITTGVTGSLMQDVANARQGTVEGPIDPELENVHAMHVEGAEEVKDEYSGYEEIGEPQVMESVLGPARRSEFKASSTFGSGLHGYRATLMGHDKQVNVICVCSEANWKNLQPAFDQLLGSLKRGQAE